MIATVLTFPPLMIHCVLTQWSIYRGFGTGAAQFAAKCVHTRPSGACVKANAENLKLSLIIKPQCAQLFLSGDFFLPQYWSISSSLSGCNQYCSLPPRILLLQSGAASLFMLQAVKTVWRRNCFSFPPLEAGSSLMRLI